MIGCLESSGMFSCLSADVTNTISLEPEIFYKEDKLKV